MARNEGLTSRQVALLQKVYSNLYLDGLIEESLYRSVCINSTFSMLGIRPIDLGVITDQSDMSKLEDLVKPLARIAAKAKQSKGGE